MSTPRTTHYAGALLLAALAVHCGSTTAPTPSPAPQAPTMPGPFANVAGLWSGTIQSGNAETRTITLNAVQSSNCVDGTWATTSRDWTGAISGYAGADSYSGQMSIELTVDGKLCTGITDVSGPVGSDTIDWTATGFSLIGQCDSALPQSVVITLHRS